MTHINAYYGAVEEALKKVLTAQAELETAKAALEVKKLEDQPAEVVAPQEKTSVEDKKAFGRR